ncbi:hypothetical protein MA04_01438 [Alcanivorax balearicus MACL04]|uniref:Pilus assembly protein n=1 Tax=Alloalcanivorax balearicus MACL04 TaxID=1177182 RepID=A0ABT2QXA9_9GAMM|nr:hypothetical protein [Alloalcanivorax balearicus]MCU5782138.1 hypothetical protein [Alloalcanivorax balearicus MACL04]
MKMIQSFNTAIQSLMVRLFTQMPTRSNRQRGASALEYVVLVALIVVIIVAAIAFLDESAVSAVFAPIKSAISGA